jgi:ABC-type amino acid transport substrate-binding protein
LSLATYNNTLLRDKLNQALASMDKDGTTAKLVKIYVTGLPGDVDSAVNLTQPYLEVPVRLLKLK